LSEIWSSFHDIAANRQFQVILDQYLPERYRFIDSNSFCLLKRLSFSSLGALLLRDSVNKQLYLFTKVVELDLMKNAIQDSMVLQLTGKDWEK